MRARDDSPTATRNPPTVVARNLSLERKTPGRVLRALCMYLFIYLYRSIGRVVNFASAQERVGNPRAASDLRGFVKIERLIRAGLLVT